MSNNEWSICKKNKKSKKNKVNILEVVKKKIKPRIYEVENKTKLIPVLNSMRYNDNIVKNQNPKLNVNISKEVWEYVYFEHIINLLKIFTKHLRKILPDITTNNTYFLDDFIIFIRASSSGSLSNYIEKLSPKLEKLYLEFIIKRNDNIYI